MRQWCESLWKRSTVSLCKRVLPKSSCFWRLISTLHTEMFFASLEAVQKKCSESWLCCKNIWWNCRMLGNPKTWLPLNYIRERFYIATIWEDYTHIPGIYRKSNRYQVYLWSLSCQRQSWDSLILLYLPMFLVLFWETWLWNGLSNHWECRVGMEEEILLLAMLPCCATMPNSDVPEMPKKISTGA